ncbi:MAG: NAD(P)H-hydrate dehydratase, partial [Chloroflexota bacterium]
LEDIQGDDSARVLTASELLPGLPCRSFDFHKGQAGRVGVIAGSRGYVGAAILTATGALRGGAGLITLYVKEDSYPIFAAQAPAEVMVKPVVKLLVKQPAEKPEPAKGPLTSAAPSSAATPRPAATAAPTAAPAAEARSELKLTVSQPENESVVSASTVTVKGATSPDAVVSINGAVATIAADGAFSQDVSLQPGPNRIEVLASTFDGQSKSQVINLIRLAS